MKKPSIKATRNRLILFIILLLIQLSMTAQLQWYQNQDGLNQPNGTYGTSISSFGNSSFIACYLWTIDNDQYTWKISKTSTGGQEQKRFFVTGTTAMAEVRIGRYNTVYVLLRDFPLGQNPVYTIYKLNSNLQVIRQYNISFPGDFNIFNLNAFELDESDNVYVAGDGQYADGPGYSPASFVIKTDKHLIQKWKMVDSTETSYSRLHVEDNGKVVVIEDHYAIYPSVRVTKISGNGQHVHKKTVSTDEGRLSLASAMDKHNNLFLYGVKPTPDGKQAIFLKKLSKYNSTPVYHKTYFSSSGIELNDLRLDNASTIYTLVTGYTETGDQSSRISRINASNGHVSWNRVVQFSEDSCVLSRIVMGRNERLYAIGERKSQQYFSKGYAVRVKKNGQPDGHFPAPDSIAFQRSHVLLGGIVDHDNRLITIGNTNDFDTMTWSSSYYRAFTARFGQNPGGGGNHGCDELSKQAAPFTESESAEDGAVSVNLYPNPADLELIVSNLSKDGFDQLTIYNMSGVAVVNMRNGTNSIRLDVSALPAGVYIMHLRSSATRLEKRIKFLIKR